jgi:hypothetical protein
MLTTTNTRLRVGVVVLALALGAFVLLACGSGSSTPTLVSTAAPASGQGSQPTTGATQKAQPTAAAITQDKPTAAPQPTPSTQEFKIGDIINIKDFNLAVLGWEEPKGNEFAKPDEGKKFIAVELVIVNASKNSTSISSLAQMELKDSSGQKYAVDFLASTAAGSKAPEGEIAAGEKVRGKVGFAVPVDAKGLIFVFDASLFGSGKVLLARQTDGMHS